MVTAFTQILNMSLTASVVIVFVLAARLLLKRAPKTYSYALWSVVLFRLLCPVSLSAPVSVLEVTQPKVTARDNISAVYYAPVEQVTEDSGWYTAESSMEEPVSVQELERRQMQTAPTILEISGVLWLIGMLVMGLYSLCNYLRLRFRLVGAVHWRGEIYFADHIDTPFVLGIILPKIYLPSDLPVPERRYIVAHERHHIKRFDPLVKLLAYIALCIHWFNPLVWVAFCFAGKDIEMSCDEAVIKRLGPEIRADYAQSLLRLATHHRILSGMPLAFGEGDTKSRVKNMVKWKRPKVWVSAVCIVLCVGIGLVCALNPEEDIPLEEMTRMEGPVSCAVGDLNYYIPEGCAHASIDSLQLNDWELKKALKEKKGLYPYNIIFLEGETTVGGINSYYLPESYTPAHFDWIEDLGLWEFEDETLGHYGESGREYAWSLEFFTDLPGYPQDKQLRKHYFFLSEDSTMVNDLWFDMTAVTNGIYRQILDSCVVGGDSHKQVATTRMFLDFEMILPDNFIMLIDDTNTRKLVTANTIVGGITAYEKPDFDLKFSSRYPLKEWNADAWLAAMGYEEDKTLAYMGGSSLYGDFERNYTSDVPEGQPITVDEHHTFFIREEYVYDVWFDMLKVSEAVADEILAGIAGKREAAPVQTEPILPPDLGEQEAALERCRSELDLIQSCSQSLRCERNNGYDNGIMEYWLHEGDWMTVQTHSDGSVIAFLYKNGVHYDNGEIIDGKIGALDAEGNILWKESDRDQSFHIPWLSQYQWNADHVTYLGTEKTGEETRIKLRINEPFPGFEYGNPDYEVTMVFDDTHLFLRAELSVNRGHVSQSSFTETETIVSLFSQTVSARLEQEYQRIVS